MGGAERGQSFDVGVGADGREFLEELPQVPIEKLNAQYAKLQNRIDQIYLDKLDGEVEEAFYRRNVSAWREEQAQIRARIERHEKADQNYIEQGIRLLEIARNAQEFFRTHGQAERAALLGFILPGSALDGTGWSRPSSRHSTSSTDQDAPTRK